jgi:subtilisin-like proprotein convertase family protein/subtilisin family serine protease
MAGLYTYRAGVKLPLEKKPDEFVARMLPDELARQGIPGARQVSSASSRIPTDSRKLEGQMAQVRKAGVAHHAYAVAATGEDFAISDRILVTFRRDLSREEASRFAGKHGLILKEKFGPRDYLFQLTEGTGMNPVKLVVKLTETEKDLVELADHDLNMEIRVKSTVPTDPGYARQWHLHARFAHPEFDPRASSRCEEAWAILGHHGNPDMVVGVTDDGCRLDHPDFAGHGKLAGWGYLEGTRFLDHADPAALPARMYQRGSDHGTACAGVIAGSANGRGIVGAAPGCRLFPVKWESSGPSLFISDAKLLLVLNRLADKVDILSNSWGGAPSSIWSQAVRNRIIALARGGGRRGKGILFLWAAGNENCPIQHTGSVDIPYTDGWNYRTMSWEGVETSRVFANNLTGIPGVMHVAALCSTARRSHYSNYGTGISLCAPSNNIHTYQRLEVPGIGITTADGDTGGLTHTFGGTSSATPLAAGIAALALSANPALGALEVESLLMATASKDVDMAPYPRTPPASFDPEPSWDVSPAPPFDKGEFKDIGSPAGTWSPWFGHGKVDAAAAVARALEGAGPAGGISRFESRPGREIPDNAPGGIEDRLTVQGEGAVQALSVTVEIVHPWIGDLVLELASPDGTRVTLHERAGAGGRDIRATYTAANRPALAAFHGRRMGGEWTLRAADAARADTGTLVAWALEIASAAAPVEIEDSPAAAIPDHDPRGVTVTLQFPQGAPAREIAVSVDITHTWVGDLRVQVTPPGAEGPITLHDKEGGSADNLRRTWSSRENAALAGLLGRDLGGQWALKVSDLAMKDRGKLNKWSVKALA